MQDREALEERVRDPGTRSPGVHYRDPIDPFKDSEGQADSEGRKQRWQLYELGVRVLSESVLNAKEGSFMMRRYGSLLLAVLACTALAASMAASASAVTLKGDYAVFDNCPITNEEVRGCIYSKTESGESRSEPLPYR